MSATTAETAVHEPRQADASRRLDEQYHYRYYASVSKTAKIVEHMRRSPQSVRFDDLAKVCAEHFGEPRQDGTSHKVYKTPWRGDPRVNIQRGKDGNAKAYQVRQVLDAIARLEAENDEEGDDDA